MVLFDLCNQPVTPPFFLLKKTQWGILDDTGPKAVSEAPEDIHPVVSNPYTMLVTLLAPEYGILC